MVYKLFMPALSPTMQSGKLSKWLVKESDKVESGDAILEIETDKASMEYEAPIEGELVKIVVGDNTDDVLVNSIIGLIKEDDDTDEDVKLAIDSLNDNDIQVESKEDIRPDYVLKEKQTNTLGKDSKDNSDKVKQDRIFITPVARNFAKNSGVDINLVSSARKDNRIVKKDIEDFIKNTKNNFNDSPGTVLLDDYNKIDITPMRQIVAKRLVESKVTIPHFYLKIDCEMDKLFALRKEINSNGDIKITVNDFIVKAVSYAMRDFPEINASWSGDYIKHFKSIDIAVAVAIEGGLITPIVRNSNNKTLGTISKEIKYLANAAKEGSLHPEQYQGAGLTISNLGMYKIEEFYAIINPPQSVILAVGSAVKKAIVKDDNIVISSIMSVTVSCDHRVVDGALVALFLNKFKDYIENPVSLLV